MGPTGCGTGAARASGLCAHGCGFFWLGLRFRFGSKLFPVAALFQASSHGADFGFFLDDEWSAAFGARLGDGHVRRGEIAIGITRTAVEDARTAAATSAAATDEFAFVALGTFDAHGDRARVFAL